MQPKRLNTVWSVFSSDPLLSVRNLSTVMFQQLVLLPFFPPQVRELLEPLTVSQWKPSRRETCCQPGVRRCLFPLLPWFSLPFQAEAETKRGRRTAVSADCLVRAFPPQRGLSLSRKGETLPFSQVTCSCVVTDVNCHLDTGFDSTSLAS